MTDDRGIRTWDFGFKTCFSQIRNSQIEVRNRFTLNPQLEFAARPLLGRKNLEAGGPPAGPDGLDELDRQVFFLHLPAERFVVVVHGDKLHLEVISAVRSAYQTLT